MIPSLLPFAISFALLGCGECCGSKLVGKWDCGLGPIAIYEDGVASFSGMKATWSGVATDTIRLEILEDGETIIAELKLRTKDNEGKRVATCMVLGTRTECKKIEAEPGGRDNAEQNAEADGYAARLAYVVV